MSAITIDDDLVHYEVLGRGKPIILLHGWLGSWRYWVPTMQQLSMKYRCYALDLWGFGDSAKDPARYSIERQTDLIEKFMDRMGIPRTVLVGHGLGAVLAAQFATNRKTAHKVYRLFVVSPPLFESAPSLLKQAKALPAGAPVSAGNSTGGSNPSGDVPTESEARGLLKELRQVDRATLTGNPLKEIFTQNSLDDLLKRATVPGSPDYDKLRVEVTKSDPKAILQNIEAFNEINTLHDILHSDAATALLTGLNDGLLPAPDDRVLNQLDERHNLRLILMPGINHFPMLEENAQFVRLLKEFVEAPDIASLEMKEEWRRRKR